MNTSDENCGACGIGCPTGQGCMSGACVCRRGTQPTVCDGQCIDLASDPMNCGACGKQCFRVPDGGVPIVGSPASSFSCSLGQCRVYCASGLTDCNGACVDTNEDIANCGQCDVACAGTTSCVSGVCTCPLPDQTNCNGLCVDTKVDGANCGACDVQCPIGSTCTASGCAIQCPAGQSPCNGSCIDLSSTKEHCGFAIRYAVGT